jgi:hypothetical protein
MLLPGKYFITKTSWPSGFWETQPCYCEREAILKQEGKVGPSSAIHPAIIAGDDFSLYKELFVSGCYGIKGGFLIQLPGKTWFDPKRKIRDSDVMDHLEQQKSVAAIPAYYPTFFTIDLDFYPSQADSPYGQVEDRVLEVIDKFQLHESEYLRITSPSYQESGNQHIIVKGIYNGEPVSARLIRKILAPIAMNAGLELYPWGARKLRLPFGYGQYLIDNEDGSPLTYSWAENLQRLSQLDPVDLERYPYQSYYTRNSETGSISGSTKEDGKYLWEHGLQAYGTRHVAVGAVARLLYFRNLGPDATKDEVKKWLRVKHNDFSIEIKKGNWRVVDADVDDWVEDTYTFFEKNGIYPISIHNMQGWMTRADVDFILDVFPGDWVNQKRLCRLLQHYRGRTRGERKWITLHRNLWRRLGGNGYLQWRQVLERSILEVNPSYRAGMYSKSILLRLPPASPSQMLQDKEGRAVNEWRKALLMAFGDNMAAAMASGTNFQRFYEQREK